MGKYILLTLVAITFCLMAKSQTTRLEYGLQAGLNINSANKTVVSKDIRGVLTGLSLGGHLKWSGAGHFGLRVLVSYDENGWKYRSLTFEDNTGTGLIKADLLYKLNYLNIPVLAEYSFGNKVQVNIGAGLFIGFLLNNKTITNFKEPLPPGQPAVISTSSTGYRPLNYGISTGFGMQVPIASKIKLDIDLSNHTGFAHILNSKASNNSKLQTNCLAISGGMSFEW